MFIKLLLTVYLYFKGITFFKTSTVPSKAEFIRAEFRTVQNHKIHFAFYREQFSDLVYKRRMFKRRKYTGIIINAQFDDRLPDGLTSMNSMKFLFKDTVLNLLSDKIVSNMLLDLYLDYIKVRLEQSKNKDIDKEYILP